MACRSESSPHDDGETFARPRAKFHEDLWGDYFLNYREPDDEETQAKDQENEMKKLEEEVKREFYRVVGYDEPCLEQLNFFDAVERLGLAYRFEKELDAALQKIYESYDDYKDKHGLYLTSLMFRLLRQNGFHVSSGIFSKFKDEGGSFKSYLADDVPGLLSLYEASHLMVHGEDVLDEALVFTKSHLKKYIASHEPNNHPMAAQVSHALNQPLHRGMPRLESEHFISVVYENDPSHNKILLRLAKLDFNLLQSLHKKELRDLTRWWKSFDFMKKLPFTTRDRIAESFFWTLAPYYEPQFSLGRKIFCKVFKLVSIIDDTYDAYGTIEELVPYTEAIQRWDRSCLDQLPDYMKLSYEFLIDTFEEFERDLAQQGRSHVVHYAKEEVKACIRGYLQEAQWLHAKYIPTYEEYMTKAAIVTFGYYMGTVVAFLGMGEVASKEAFEWARQYPKLLEATSIIGRLMDDMTGHTFEQSRGHVASAVECYMKQYDLTEEQTREAFQQKINDAWKDINQALLRPYNVIPRPLLTCILNLARIVDVIYKEEDGYTFSGNSTKDHISRLLTDPLPL